MDASSPPTVSQLHSLPPCLTSVGPQSVRPRPVSLPSSKLCAPSFPGLDLPDTTEQSNEFWDIWLQHQDYLYGFCLKLTGQNHTEANELLSKARDKAQAKWPKHAHKITNAKSWLSSLTRNLYLDLCRSRTRQAKAHSGLQKEMLGAIGHQTTPESTLLHQELQDYLHQLIEELPPKLRDPFILRFLHDKSYKAIALQLTLTEATVRKRIQYARQQLHEPLRQYLSGFSEETVSANSAILNDFTHLTF